MKRSNKVREEGAFSRIAFTLAEVLITLAIIGVVAALTIPTVVQNYRKTQAITQLKKTYSAIANTTNLAIAEHGPITEWDVKNHSEGAQGQGSIDFANKYLIPYLKVSKNCDNKDSGDCIFNYTYLNTQTGAYFGKHMARFYLNDGTLIGVISSNVYDEGLLYKYAYITLDINGQKKPNTFGKDIFYFIYYVLYGTQNNSNNGKFVPYGYNYSMDSLKNDCNKDKRGEACAALIMRQGWQMKDDYPW